jgi:hypothetical protein
VAGFVNESNPDGINNHSVFLDMNSNRIHMGDPDTTAFFNTSLKGFLLFENQKDEVDDGGWAVRIEDMLYGKT